MGAVVAVVAAPVYIGMIIKSHCDDKNREEAYRTEQRVREEQERVEREKRLAIERAQRQRQMALDQMRTNQNLTLCKDFDAKRTIEYERFCTAAQEIFADRNMRIAEIEKQHNAFVCRQRVMLSNKESDLKQSLVMRLDSQHQEEDAMDRRIAERRAQLEKKRIDMENARKAKTLKKELWNALCKMLTSAETDLLAHLPPEMLSMLEPEQLEMLNRFSAEGRNANDDGKEQIKEEFRKILIQSGLILRAILDKYELTNAKNSAVEVQIDAQKALEMGSNDLFFVLSNGGEMFSKILVEADHLDVAEFIAALCNYASMTELPQLIVPNIVLQFNKPIINQIPNMAANCSKFHCEKNNGNMVEYVAKNSAVPSVKCVVKIFTSSGQHPPKLANFQMTIVSEK